jgi:hypothetical protein
MLFNPHELIFSSGLDFTEKALMIFRYQYANNELYKRFVDSLNCDVDDIKSLEAIPFLPISFFKSHSVATTFFSPALVFESSGTTGSINSKHGVKDLSIYEKSFIAGFELIYGPVGDYCILGLLPSYMERQNSSLVYMVQKMMDISRHRDNGFYLNDYDLLHDRLIKLEAGGKRYCSLVLLMPCLTLPRRNHWH